MIMNKLIVKSRFIFFVLITLSLTSCSLAQIYYTDISAIGNGNNDNNDNSFYVAPSEDIEYDYLEYNEYVSVLSDRLEQLGYTRAGDGHADLKVELKYNIGDRFLVTTTDQVKTVSEVKEDKEQTFKGDTTITKQLLSTTTHSMEHLYAIPVYLEISAINTITNLPQWRVKVESVVENRSQVHEMMIWMINASQWFIGKSYNGRAMVGIGRDLEEYFGRKYNLYGIRKVQSIYYKNYDVILREVQ